MFKPNNVQTIAKVNKKFDKADQKRHERLLKGTAEDFKKQAEALAKKVNDLQEESDGKNGVILFFLLTTISAVGYIIYDKCCAAKDADTKTPRTLI